MKALVLLFAVSWLPPALCDKPLTKSEEAKLIQWSKVLGIGVGSAGLVAALAMKLNDLGLNPFKMRKLRARERTLRRLLKKEEKEDVLKLKDDKTLREEIEKNIQKLEKAVDDFNLQSSIQANRIFAKASSKKVI